MATYRWDVRIRKISVTETKQYKVLQIRKRMEWVDVPDSKVPERYVKQNKLTY